MKEGKDWKGEGWKERKKQIKISKWAIDWIELKVSKKVSKKVSNKLSEWLI